jgi:hypothetical protein
MSLLDFGPIASFLGRGEASITVPTLDGAFRPNDFLETADLFGEYAGADTIVVADGRLLLSAGREVLQIGPGTRKVMATFDDDITALCAEGAAIAVGLASGGVSIVGGPHDGSHIDAVKGKPLTCPTALLLEGDRLTITEGSDRTTPAHWSRDLLERNVCGRVVRVDLNSGQQETLASKVAYANGLVKTPAGDLVISQSWRHCLSPITDLSKTGSPCHNLPGYPSRISAADDGGYWLAIFGVRTQLIEFVLREDQYRKRMLDTIAPEHWIAPSLVSQTDFLAPLQQGAVKKLGVLKPWAPPRSYGLVVKLDSGLRPLFSLHSRVGGLRHGVTSAVEVDGVLYVVSKGAGQVVAVDLASVQREIVQ